MSVGGFGDGENSIVTDGLVYYIDGYNTKSIREVDEVFDLTKNNNIGFFSGPGSAGSSYSGDSLTFDGNGGFFQVNSTPSIDSFTTGLTVNIFMKSNDLPSSNGNDYDTLLMKSSDWNWNDGFGFYWEGSSGEFRFFVNDWDNFKASDIVGSGSTAIPLTNYCGVYNGSNVLLYKDGGLIDTGNILTANVNNTGDKMHIGCGMGDALGNAGFYSSATIYLVMIYNRALTPTEISNNHNVLNYRFR